MKSKKTILNGDQVNLVAELTQAYDAKPEEIMFFEADQEPFLGYDLSCKMLNRLLNPQGIDAFPVPSAFDDSIQMKVVLTNRDGSTRSNVGVANKNETDENGNPLTNEQLIALANSRGLRSTLRSASINLIELHKNRGKVTSIADGGKSNSAALIGQAHVLGKEIGLIYTDSEGNTNKQLWRRALIYRYGVEHSNELSESGLADFVAFLQALRPAQRAAA
jgi:hypothetical protein